MTIEALSVEQAVSSLMGESPDATEIPADEAPNAAAVEAEEIPSEETAEEPEATEDETLEAEEEVEDVEAAEPVEPPTYWSKDAKAKFAELPPELQAVVLEQEGPREAAAAKAKAEAQQVREAAQKDIDSVKLISDQLNEFLPQVVQLFNERWGVPDFAAVAQEYGADQAYILEKQYQQEQANIQRLAASQAQATQQAREAYIRDEAAKLHTIAPDLMPDPSDMSKGQDKRGEVFKFLMENEYTPETIADASARDYTIARDAMLWRQAQAKGQAVPKKPINAPAKSGLKPSAVPQASSPQRTAMATKNRFTQTRSVEDAIAVLMSRGQ